MTFRNLAGAVTLGIFTTALSPSQLHGLGGESHLVALQANQAPTQIDQPKQPSPHIERWGLGTKRTIVMVLASECEVCWESIDFYRQLLAAPGMDGKQKRFIVLAADGVWPVGKALDAKSFKPHRLLSYPSTKSPIELPNSAPAILVVDGDGVRLGMWVGRLTTAEQKEVVAAVEGNH